jgi:hypothetical protein
MIWIALRAAACGETLFRPRRGLDPGEGCTTPGEGCKGGRTMESEATSDLAGRCAAPTCPRGLGATSGVEARAS